MMKKVSLFFLYFLYFVGFRWKKMEGELSMKAPVVIDVLRNKSGKLTSRWIKVKTGTRIRVGGAKQ